MSAFEDLKPSFKNALMERAKYRQPFWNMLGLELMDVKKGWSKMRLPYSENLIHPFGVVHGGAIFSLADSAVAMALIGLAGKDEKFATIEMKINYVRPFDRGEITAEAKIVNMSSRIVLGEVAISNDQGELVATSTATYMLFGQKR